MEQEKGMSHMQGMSYKKFMVLMLISFLIMYLVMFLNMERISHYHTSTTRIYMALLMVAPMAVVMMIIMGKMYPDKKINTGIMFDMTGRSSGSRPAFSVDCKKSPVSFRAIAQRNL
ncbi:MAG: hypothetical protein ACXWV5_04600 [Flavitalea sp.]